MENRFGVKDFVIVILLVAVIVMVTLCMVQYDRQWDAIRQANDQLRNQTHDLASIRRMLEQGATTATTQPSSGSAVNSNAGFERILKARANADYAQGDSIVAAFAAAPPRLTPIISEEAGASTIDSHIFEGLFSRDPDTLAWVPSLGISYTISDDLKTIDVVLRRGVTFSDGEPFTADDVVYTFDLMMNPDVEDPGIKTYFDRFDHAEKTGDYSVRFLFKEPYFKSFEMISGMPMLPKHFYSQFDIKTLNESTGLVMGTGPFCVADPKGWKPQPGKPIELLRNERYWGVPPAANKLTWKVIANASARLTSFRNGEVDLLTPTPEQYVSMLGDNALVARTQHFDLRIPNIGYTYIGWNEKIGGKPTRFADKRVRQALTMLIDREAICKDIAKGYAEVNSSCFSSLTKQSDPSIKPWPYAPDQAMKLLADAGYHKENDVLVGPDGQPFKFKLTNTPASPVRVQVLSFVKDSLARAGIIVEPDEQEWSVLLQRNKDRQLEAVILGWTAGVEDDPYQIFSSKAAEGVGDNTVSYTSPQLDEAMESARKMKDETKRMELWHQVHRILHEDQPYTFLFISHSLQFVDGRFKNVQPTVVGLNPNDEWYVPQAQQKYHD